MPTYYDKGARVVRRPRGDCRGHPAITGPLGPTGHGWARLRRGTLNNKVAGSGAGGSSWGNAGTQPGGGGGEIDLTVGGTLTVTGALRADGGPGVKPAFDTNLASGGGSGGSGTARWDIARDVAVLPEVASATVSAGATLTQSTQEAVHLYSLMVATVGDLTIAGAINVDAKGYGPGQGTNAGGTAPTPAYNGYPCGGGGGGHGGSGAPNKYCNNQTLGGDHLSLTAPGQGWGGPAAPRGGRAPRPGAWGPMLVTWARDGAGAGSDMSQRSVFTAEVTQECLWRCSMDRHCAHGSFRLPSTLPIHSQIGLCGPLPAEFGSLSCASQAVMAHAFI